MSEQTPSQGFPSDPRNEDDYDTWEYGTEPLPGDDAWSKQQQEYNDAFDSLLDQLGDIGLGVGEAFESIVDPERVSYEEIQDVYDNDTDEVDKWNEMLDIANDPDPGPTYSEMIWEAERKKSQYPKGRGFRMKLTDTDEWLRKKKRVSE